MRCNPLLAVLLAIAALLVDRSVIAQESPFNETFEVTKNQWHRGESVRLRHTLCNVTGSTLHLECASSCSQIGDVVIKNAEDIEVARYFSSACAGVCRPETWEVEECRSETLEWPQVTGHFPHPGDVPHSGDGFPVESGTYYAETVFDDPPLRTSNFQILAASMPIPMLGGVAMTILLALLMVVGSYVLGSRRV